MHLFCQFSEKEKISQRNKDLPVSMKTSKNRIVKLDSDTVEQLTQDLS